MNFRAKKIESVLFREVSTWLDEFFPPKRYGLTSVTDVRLSKKGESARVAISVEKNKHHFEDDAKKAAVAIGHEIAKSGAVKRTPKLIFSLDDTTDLLAKLEEIEANL